MDFHGSADMVPAGEVLLWVAQEHEKRRSFATWEECQAEALETILARLLDRNLVAWASEVHLDCENPEIGFSPNKLINPEDLLHQTGFGKVPLQFWCHFQNAHAGWRSACTATGDFRFRYKDNSSAGLREGSAYRVLVERPGALTLGYPASTTSDVLSITVQQPSRDQSAPSGRAPSVKNGPFPADEEILAKAVEMKARGMNGRAIAKSMRFEEGFENTPTTYVRQLIKGRWPRGRLPKASG